MSFTDSYYHSQIPSTFAKRLAESVELYEYHDEFMKLPESEQKIIMKQHYQLVDFCNIGLACSYDESVIVYHGEELSEEQVTALQVIHKSNVPYVMGNILEKMLRKLESERIANKDLAALVDIIVTQIIREGGGVSPAQANGLLIKVQDNEYAEK